MGSQYTGSQNAKHIVFGDRNIEKNFGVKITSAQREYYRYTGISAEVERHGTGSTVHGFTRFSIRERGERPPE
jgi:hypothetical protein